MDQWETFSDIRTTTEAAGFSISRDQLERWRNKGLLPKVTQIGKGRGAGSEVRYPLGTARQAVAIATLLSVKEKFDFVGWELWVRGYPVDERYWRRSIEGAFLNVSRIPAYLRLMQSRHRDDSATIFDRLEIGLFQTTLFGKPLARLHPNLAAYIFGTMADIATGKFTGFSSVDDGERLEHLALFLAIAGIPQSGSARKLAKMLGFEAEIEPQLIAISEAFADMQRGWADIDLDRLSPVARAEFFDVMEICRSLHRLFLNSKGSPLHTAVRILVPNRKTQAHLLLIWSYFRTRETIMPSDKIRELLELTLKSLDEMIVSR
jgi:hypothetical protein